MDNFKRNLKQEAWMTPKPLDIFFFDFDGTLSLMEGIDVLAKMNGVEEKVQAITQRCMAETGLSVAAYSERLNYVRPSAEQIPVLAELYKQQITPGASELMGLLKSMGKTVYIISAGIKESLIPLASEWAIPADRVLAVDVYFNKIGRYQGFNEQSFMVQSQGKNRQIVQVLKNKETAFLIGDGLSDSEASPVVDRFVGFAGNHPKKKVREDSKFFINTNRLYSAIQLGLTYQEQLSLPEVYQPAYDLGHEDISKGLVIGI